MALATSRQFFITIAIADVMLCCPNLSPDHLSLTHRPPKPPPKFRLRRFQRLHRPWMIVGSGTWLVTQTTRVKTRIGQHAEHKLSFGLRLFRYLTCYHTCPRTPFAMLVVVPKRNGGPPGGVRTRRITDDKQSSPLRAGNLQSYPHATILSLRMSFPWDTMANHVHYRFETSALIG